MPRPLLLYNYFLHSRLDLFAVSNLCLVKDLQRHRLKEPFFWTTTTLTTFCFKKIEKKLSSLRHRRWEEQVDKLRSPQRIPSIRSLVIIFKANWTFWKLYRSNLYMLFLQQKYKCLYLVLSERFWSLSMASGTYSWFALWKKT